MKTLTYIFGYPKSYKTTNLLKAIDELLSSGQLKTSEFIYHDLDKSSKYDSFKRDYINNYKDDGTVPKDNKIIIIDSIYPLITSLEKKIVDEFNKNRSEKDKIISVSEIPYGAGVSKLLSYFRNKIESIDGNLLLISHCKNRDDDTGKTKKDIFFIQRNIVEYLTIQADTCAFLDKDGVLHFSKNKSMYCGTRMYSPEVKNITLKDFLLKLKTI
ncbi:MAG: hypothetical protein NZM44_05355 [Candidatus Calescibacterium sp.]|nr:hypothetical protein [Candidatus Calescibacterium sp.]